MLKEEMKFKIGDEVMMVKSNYSSSASNIGKNTFVTDTGRSQYGLCFVRTKDLKNNVQDWISQDNFVLVHRKGQGYYKK